MAPFFPPLFCVSAARLAPECISRSMHFQVAVTKQKESLWGSCMQAAERFADSREYGEAQCALKLIEELENGERIV